MTLAYLQKYEKWYGKPQWNVMVRDEILRQVGGVGGRQPTQEEKDLLKDTAQAVLNRAERENLPVDMRVESLDKFQIAMHIINNPDTSENNPGRARITADNQATGQLPSLPEQAAIVKAIKDSSPLKPIDDLIAWLKKVWNEVVKPTLESIKQMFDALWPLIRDTLRDLPKSLDIIRRDLIVPYLKACENWKEYVDKLANDLRHGPKAAAKDMDGMPYIPGPNLDVAEATKIKTAFMIPPVRAMALGTLAPLEMLERQSNTYRGFYGPVQYYSWLLSNEVGPDIGGLISDAFGIGRRAGRVLGGVGDALSGAGDVLGDIPEWFISNTVPKIDVATGKMDYYLY